MASFQASRPCPYFPANFNPLRNEPDCRILCLGYSNPPSIAAAGGLNRRRIRASWAIFSGKLDGGDSAGADDEGSQPADDEDSEETRINHPGVAVVALLRHFGCFCCWELALQLKEAKGKFDSAGVKLIAIGVGTPDKAKLLADGLPFPSDSLYADPERKAYEILGLHYGFFRTFSTLKPGELFARLDKVKKSTNNNYTIKATPNISGVLQQGGMFVFKGKKLLYARKDEKTGDHAPMDDIINICCKVPQAA